MPRRAGAIEKRGPNKWLIRLDLGRDTNGKRRRSNRTINGTKNDAERALRELLRQRDLGLLIQASQQSLNEYLQHWLDTSARPRVEETTLDDYRDLLERYIIPHLGNLELQQLTPAAIQARYASMLQQGLSPRTVKYTHSVLNSALKQAVKWRLLAINPAQTVDLPRQTKREIRVLTEEEAQRFLNATKTDPWHAYFALLLGTGLRPSEGLALHWQDLDLANKRLLVRRSAARTKGRTYLKAPKTNRGRQVTLPTSLCQLLAGTERTVDLVFPGELGGIADISAIRRRHFKPGIQRAGIEGPVRLYDLRQTHATLLLLANIHPKVVSERLGHASVTITLDTYSHVLPTMQREGAERIDELLFSAFAPSVSSSVN